MPLSQIFRKQVLALIARLSPEKKDLLLHALSSQSNTRREGDMNAAAARLRILASETGKDWDNMPDEERIAFIDDLVHNERQSTNSER